MTKLVEPMLFVNSWRFLMIAVLIHLWIIGDFVHSSFILILLLLMMTSLRWRFTLPIWSNVIDVVICILFFPITDISYFGLALPIFELAMKGKWIFSLFLFMSLFTPSPSSSLIFWFYLQSLLFGIFSFISVKNQEMYRLEVDEQRRARYELERLKIELLTATQSASHQAN
nr:hypothetical protein [Paenibacillus bovis]